MIGRGHWSHPYTRKGRNARQTTTAQCHSRPSRARYWSILSTGPPRSTDRNKILCNSQHRFRCKRSCESQLVVCLILERPSTRNLTVVSFTTMTFEKTRSTGLNRPWPTERKRSCWRGHIPLKRPRAPSHDLVFSFRTLMIFQMLYAPLVPSCSQTTASSLRASLLTETSRLSSQVCHHWNSGRKAG